MFPLSIKGSVRLKLDAAPTEKTVKAAVDRIADMLDFASASSVTIEENSVRFAVRAFRLAWSWNILVPYTNGHLIVAAQETSLHIGYRLSTVRMFASITAILTALVVFLAWRDSELWSEPPFALSLLAVASFWLFGWLWLFGMSYLLAVIRFPLWLRRGLRKDPEPKKR